MCIENRAELRSQEIGMSLFLLKHCLCHDNFVIEEIFEVY